LGLRLLDHQAPAGKASDAHGARSAGRGVSWNVNMVFGGVSPAAVRGLLLGPSAGAGRMAVGLFVAPPHGVFPLVSLVTGLSMAATGVMGMDASRRSALVAPFLAASAANYVLMYLNFTVVQVGAIQPTGPPQAALHSDLVLLTGLIGPYCAVAARKARAKAAVAKGTVEAWRRAVRADKESNTKAGASNLKAFHRIVCKKLSIGTS